jgi:2-dehydropantoate 2-reductase
MNIAVIGIGGVGGFFGGKLTQLIKSDSSLHIHFIARGRHLDEIRNNGLLLDTDEGEFICRPTSATDDISVLPELDLCLVCVKSYDLEKAMMMIKDKIKDKTMILPLLNGVDIYERIRGVIKKGIVFPSAVYIGTYIERPGKVTQRGGACKILFGKDPSNDYIDSSLFNLFDSAGIKYELSDNPYTAIWSKFIFIAPFGLVCARYNKTIGEVMKSDGLTEIVKNIMREISAIASRKGIELPSDIIDKTYVSARNFPFDTKTSFQRDVENITKSDERDLFGGSIIRMGKDNGVATPATEAVYNEIGEMKPLK